jgi:hypothetical protein
MKRLENDRINLQKSIERFFSTFEKKDYIAILIITIYIFTFFKPVVSGDGFGYHSILEGYLRDNTMNFTQQQRYNEIANMGIILHYNNTGLYNTRYSFGTAVLSSPIYAMSLFLDDYQVFHIKDEFFLKERGDILIHLASIPITSIIFLYTGLFITMFILKKYYSKKYAWLAIILVFFFSPLIRYGVYDLSYTHAIEVGLMSILILLFLRDSRKEYMGIVLGILATVKYDLVLLVIPFIFYYLYYRRWKDVLRLIAGFAPFVVLILVYNTMIFGSPLSTGYNRELIISGVYPVHFLDITFNIDRGILWWTPGILISLFGLLLIKDDKKWVFLSLFSILYLFLSFFWFYHSAWGFGNRYFTLFFPLYAIGTAKILKDRPKYRYLLYASMIYTIIIYFVFLVYVKDVSILHMWNHLLNPQDMAKMPGLVFEKTGIVRFLFEIGR